MGTRRGFLKRILSAGAAVPLAALPKGDDPEVAALKARLADLEKAGEIVEVRDEWDTVQDVWDTKKRSIFAGDRLIWQKRVYPTVPYYTNFSASLSIPDPGLYKSGPGWVSVAATVAQYGTLEASPEWAPPLEDKWPNE